MMDIPTHIQAAINRLENKRIVRQSHADNATVTLTASQWAIITHSLGMAAERLAGDDMSTHLVTDQCKAEIDTIKESIYFQVDPQLKELHKNDY